MPSIEVNQSDIDKVTSMLWYINNGAKKALVKSVNKTAKSTKTQWSKEIRKDLDLDAARIKQDISIEKANYSHISGATYVKQPKTNPSLFSFNSTWWDKPGNHAYSKPWKKKEAWKIYGAFVAVLNSGAHICIRKYRDKRHNIGAKAAPGYFAQFPKKSKYRSFDVVYGPSPYDAAGYQPLLGPLTTKMSAFLLLKMEKETQDLIRRAAR